MNTNNFIKKWGNITEPYLFYDGEIELRYDVANHKYFRISNDELISVPSVTSICHIIDKSNVLIPWACRMMADKILDQIPVYVDHFKVGEVEACKLDLTFEEFTSIILDAKSAHKDKLEDAADIGKDAHAWIEDYIKFKLDKERLCPPFPPKDEKSQNCCKAACDWIGKHNVRWICTERKIYSKTYDFAGTLDGLALVDSCGGKCCVGKSFKDAKCLIDWKSSNYLYIEYLLQTAAYECAIEEELPKDLLDCLPIQYRWIIRLGKEDGAFDPWLIDREHYLEDWQAFKAALDLSRSVDALNARMDIKKFAATEERKRARRESSEAEKKAKAEIKEKVRLEKEAKKKSKSVVKSKEDGNVDSGK
jgi:hypothetical protein